MYHQQIYVTIQSDREFSHLANRGWIAKRYKKDNYKVNLPTKREADEIRCSDSTYSIITDSRHDEIIYFRISKELCNSITFTFIQSCRLITEYASKSWKFTKFKFKKFKEIKQKNIFLWNFFSDYVNIMFKASLEAKVSSLSVKISTSSCSFDGLKISNFKLWQNSVYSL